MERDFRRSPPAVGCILQFTSLSSGGTCSLTGGWRGVSLATSFLRGLVLSSPLSGVSFLTLPLHFLLRGHSSYLCLLLLWGTGLTSFSSLLHLKLLHLGEGVLHFSVLWRIQGFQQKLKGRETPQILVTLLLGN